jgi:hypothetical protein
MKNVNILREYFPSDKNICTKVATTGIYFTGGQVISDEMDRTGKFVQARMQIMEINTGSNRECINLNNFINSLQRNWYHEAMKLLSKQIRIVGFFKPALLPDNGQE